MKITFFENKESEKSGVKEETYRNNSSFYKRK